MSKKIIIIGGGIAGLCTGCYGRLNGYDTEIYEMHDIPGGLCMSWDRKGYTFDGCIDYLIGANPSSPYNRFWNEIKAFEGKKTVTHDLYVQYEGEGGKKLVFGADLEKLERDLLEQSPQDELLIREFIQGVRKFSKFTPPMEKPSDMFGITDLPKIATGMLPMMGSMNRFSKITVAQFAQKFRDPFLREAFANIFPGDYTLLILVMVLGYFASKDASWPIGGSLEFIRGIEKNYTQMGGIINYKARVEKILVKGDRAYGVRLADGSEHSADYVVSASDGYNTIFRMLDGKYINDQIRFLYDGAPTSSTCVQVSLGVDCDLSGEPDSMCIKLDKPINAGNREHGHAAFKHFCYDSTMCPQGKTSIKCYFPAEYDYWAKMYEDRKAYLEEKSRVGREFAAAFEQRFPAAKGKIEVIDVATPVTYYRYTGTWKGIFMSWRNTPEYPMPKVPTTLPGLSGFYMAGQWGNSSGGLPTGLLTGRWTLQRICKADGKKFRTA